MSALSQIIFFTTLIGTPLILIFNVKVALILMLTANLSGLISLSLKSLKIEGKSRSVHWWVWSVHGLLMIAVYMAIFGVANIVGSGRKFSARMAVSTLRTLHWAERQCTHSLDRVCTIGEMKLETPAEGLNTALLRTDFHRVIEGANGQPIRPPADEQRVAEEFGRLGQYLIMLRPIPDRGERSWIAYTWPATDPTLQAFCIDDREEILELPINDQGQAYYLGLDRRPKATACLGALHLDPNPPLTPDQEAAIANGEKPPAHTHIGKDQRTWRRWRGKRTRISKSKTPLPAPVKNP